MLYFKLAGADVVLANETHAHQGFKFYMKVEKSGGRCDEEGN
jgi:hypothetical protein